MAEAKPLQQSRKTHDVSTSREQGGKAYVATIKWHLLMIAISYAWIVTSLQTLVTTHSFSRVDCRIALDELGHTLIQESDLASETQVCRRHNIQRTVTRKGEDSREKSPRRVRKGSSQTPTVACYFLPFSVPLPQPLFPGHSTRPFYPHPKPFTTYNVQENNHRRKK